MDTSKPNKIIASSIVIVYPQINLDIIDRTKLRDEVYQNSGTYIVDTRELLSVMNNQIRQEVSITNTRVEVKAYELQENNSILEPNVLPSLLKVLEILKVSEIVAYGFNHIIEYETDKAVSATFIKEKFIKDTDKITTALNGAELFGASVRFFFKKENVQYDLHIAPEAYPFSNKMGCTINCHVEEKVLPEDRRLLLDYRDSYKYLIQLMKGIL